MKPTQKHRPAIWENMLGTVYARNAAGEVRYFDYKWNDARAFAGVDVEGADPRVWKTRDRVSAGPHSEHTISRGKLVLYLKRS